MDNLKCVKCGYPWVKDNWHKNNTTGISEPCRPNDNLVYLELLYNEQVDNNKIK